MITIAGKLIRDAELKEVGAKAYHKTNFALSTGKGKDIVSVNCWFELADQCCALVKGDRVLVCGNEESREYNGRIYKDLNAEFVLKCEAIRPTVNEDAFTDITDGDIPF